MTAGSFLLWPQGWPLLLIVPAVGLARVTRDRRRRATLSQQVGPRLERLGWEVDAGERRVRHWTWTVALLLAVIALLRPYWGEEISRLEQRGVDLMICLDVSRSMLARDVEPSRLERAKAAIRSLARQARGDRLGLVVFAGACRRLVPLTRDLESFVQMVEEAGPLSVERGGTDLGAALEQALAALGPSSGEHEAIVLLTDGEDHEGRGLAAARACRERSVAVHCIALGGALGSKIAVQTGGGETFLRDATGRPVLSSMHPEGLRQIAAATLGEFIDAGVTPRPLVTLYQQRIAPMAAKTLAASEERQRHNRYQWPLLAAFGLWIFGLCLTDRRRR